MSNRRVTLGPVSTSQMNCRSALVGAELMKQGTRRMSVGPTPRMSMGGPGMGSTLMAMKEAAKEVVQSQPVGASRLSVGAIAAPAARRASVGVSRYVGRAIESLLWRSNVYVFVAALFYHYSELI